MKTLIRVQFTALAILALTALSQAQTCPGGTGATGAAKIMQVSATTKTDAGNPCGDKSGGVTFQVNDPMNRNSVTFKSLAPLEDIIGTSAQITGTLVFDPTNPQKGAHGELTVPVASLTTGIPLRDEHLRSVDWLDAAHYPNIDFRITSVGNFKPVKAGNGDQTYDVTVAGDLSLHGQTKHLEVPGRITYLKENDMTRQKLPGDLLAARASFEVPLKDFGITGPSGMPIVGAKVGQNIAVELSVIGNTAAPTFTQNAGNPCGGKAQINPGNPSGGKTGMTAENPCAAVKASAPK